MKIRLPYKHKPRFYQLPIWWGWEQNYRYMALLAHRRFGKDLEVLHLMATEMIKKSISILYFLPTRRLAEDIVWKGKTNEGIPYLNAFPKDLVAHYDNKNMTLTYINGSTIQFLGTDFTENVGVNANIVVFSEFFISKFETFELVSPIIRANHGRCFVLGTIRNKNKAYQLLQAMKGNENCLVMDYDVRDTGQISREEIEFDIKTGMIDYKTALREYYNQVLDTNEEEATFRQAMTIMRQEGRIGKFSKNPSLPVYCMFDLGVDDLTTVSFFHYLNGYVYIIDYFQDSGKSIDYYCQRLAYLHPQIQKVYLPWDGNQRGKTSAETPLNVFEKHNYRVELVPRDNSVLEGVQRTKEQLRNIYINDICTNLILSLDRYNVNKTKANRIWSHGADNIRGITRLMTGNQLAIENGMLEEKDEQSTLERWLELTDNTPKDENYETSFDPNMLPM